MPGKDKPAARMNPTTASLVKGCKRCTRLGRSRYKLKGCDMRMVLVWERPQLTGQARLAGRRTQILGAGVAQEEAVGKRLHDQPDDQEGDQLVQWIRYNTLGKCRLQ